MQVDVQGLINQLRSLGNRLKSLQETLDQMEEDGEETIEIYKLQNLLVWSDPLNIEIACDGLKQAYLDEEENKKGDN